MKTVEVRGPGRKPYEPPTLMRVVVDPIKEMLVACTRNPGKTSPSGDPFCVPSDTTCCTTGS